MIVECPSCLTKFSIDNQQLADIEDPRFNCCRCGSYFELQQRPGAAIEPLTASRAETSRGASASHPSAPHSSASHSSESLPAESLKSSAGFNDEAAADPESEEAAILDDGEWSHDDASSLDTMPAFVSPYADSEQHHGLGDGARTASRSWSDADFEGDEELDAFDWPGFRMGHEPPRREAVLTEAVRSDAVRTQPVRTDSRSDRPVADRPVADRLVADRPAGAHRVTDTTSAGARTADYSDSGFSVGRLASRGGWKLSDSDADSSTVDTAMNSQAGTWLVKETIVAAESRGAAPVAGYDASWLPDPNAELDDLLVPKRKGEQLTLLDTHAQRDGSDFGVRPDSTQSKGWSWTLGGKSLGGAAHVADHSAGSNPFNGEDAVHEALESLVTAEWPDASARRRPAAATTVRPSHHGTRFSKPDVPSESGGNSSGSFGLHRTSGGHPNGQRAAATRPTSSVESRLPRADADSTQMAGGSGHVESHRQHAEGDDGTRLDDSAIELRTASQRKTKVAQMLAQAKSRAETEIEQQISRLSSGEKRGSSEKNRPADEFADASEREEKKARKRARKQQRLLRDITFRQSRAVGKTPNMKMLWDSRVLQEAPVACIASLPVFLLVLVIMTATRLEALPRFVQTMLNVDTDSLPRLPPPGLGIVALSSSVITLDSGHQALEIRGELLNATTERFSNITILTSLFNSSNEKTQSLIVNPQNELQAAQVVALDSAAIDHLQGQLIRETKEVAPNARLPFRVVFPTYAETDTSWFSSAVYSVEREQLES